MRIETYREMNGELEMTESKHRLKKQIAPLLKESLPTEQYSAYHQEGERVKDHLKAIFNVSNAIRTGDIDKLPQGIREELNELDESVKDTIRQFPGILRNLMLTHDIAKTKPNRTFNLTEFKAPDNLEAYPSEIQAALAQIVIAKDPKAGLNCLKKAAEKAKGTEKEQAEIKVAEMEKAITNAYDALLAHFGTSQRIYEETGLGVGYIGHEEKSAEIVDHLDLPDELKKLLVKLVENHFTLLHKFDKDTKDLAAAYRQAFGGKYTEGEFRLAVAMSTLDILGSIPKGGRPDLIPVKNMLKGHREAWIADRVKEGEKDLQTALVLERLPAGVTLEAFQAELKSNKDYQILNREAKKEAQTQLLEKWTAEYKRRFP